MVAVGNSREHFVDSGNVLVTVRWEPRKLRPSLGRVYLAEPSRAEPSRVKSSWVESSLASLLLGRTVTCLLNASAHSTRPSVLESTVHFRQRIWNGSLAPCCSWKLLSMESICSPLRSWLVTDDRVFSGRSRENYPPFPPPALYSPLFPFLFQPSVVPSSYSPNLEILSILFKFILIYISLFFFGNWSLVYIWIVVDVFIAHLLASSWIYNTNGDLLRVLFIFNIL